MIGRLAADTSAAVAAGWSDRHPTKALKNVKNQNVLIMCLMVHSRVLTPALSGAERRGNPSAQREGVGWSAWLGVTIPAS